MKKIKIILAALLLSALCVTPTFSSAESAKHAKSFMSTSVTPAQVTAYLQGCGLTVDSTPYLLEDGFTYYCHMHKRANYYYTPTYCTQNSIITHEDIPA